MLKSACWLELPLARNHLFSPDFIQHSVSWFPVFYDVSRQIAGERKELFAKIQKELFQQTIAVRGRPGFYGSTGLPSWPKTHFRDPGCAPRVNFPAYRVKFWVLNFGQFGQNSPYTGWGASKKYWPWGFDGGLARSAKPKSTEGTFCTIWGDLFEKFENQKVLKVLFARFGVVHSKILKYKKYQIQKHEPYQKYFTKNFCRFII